MTQPTKQFGRRRTLLVAVLALAGLTAFSVVAAGYAAPNSAASPAAAQYRPPCLVSNTRTGSGARSLQAGIDAAAGGDTLVVKGTCLGNATIDKDLTLKGVSNPAFGTATLNGGASGSVLTINGVTVTIANLSITNGAAGGGGGILNNSGSLTLTNSTVSGNTATAQSGGGIYNNPGATVTLSDSTVSGNIAGIAGGGILNNLGTVTLTNSTVSGNTAGSFGGGIWNFGSLTLTDSTVSGNTAGTNGGGIYSPSGGVTLTGTNTFVNNNPNDCVGC